MNLFKIFICLQFFICFSAFSEGDLSERVEKTFDSAVETTKEVAEKVNSKMNETKDLRESTK